MLKKIQNWYQNRKEYKSFLKRIKQSQEKRILEKHGDYSYKGLIFEGTIKSIVYMIVIPVILSLSIYLCMLPVRLLDKLISFFENDYSLLGSIDDLSDSLIFSIYEILTIYPFTSSIVFTCIFSGIMFSIGKEEGACKGIKIGMNEAKENI